MMFLARGAKCGRFGAIGFVNVAISEPNARRSLSSDASAMEPRPKAHRLKKWRRVMQWRGSMVSNGVMGKAPSPKFQIPRKLQLPSSKFQINPKLQAPSAKHQSGGYLDDPFGLGGWCFFLAWRFGF